MPAYYRNYPKNRKNENMIESKIYIGLNDLTTNTQLFENEKYIRVLRNVCHSYKVPFSFGI